MVSPLHCQSERTLAGTLHMLPWESAMKTLIPILWAGEVRWIAFREGLIIAQTGQTSSAEPTKMCIMNLQRLNFQQWPFSFFVALEKAFCAELASNQWPGCPARLSINPLIRMGWFPLDRPPIRHEVTALYHGSTVHKKRVPLCTAAH